MPFPYRHRRCYVCGRIAVAQDPENYDDLCANCYTNRIAMREAVKNLPPPKQDSQQPNTDLPAGTTHEKK